MVLRKHNYLKSDIFFNPIFIPGFLGSRSRVWVRGPGPGYRSSHSNVIESVDDTTHNLNDENRKIVERLNEMMLERKNK